MPLKPRLMMVGVYLKFYRLLYEFGQIPARKQVPLNTCRLSSFEIRRFIAYEQTSVGLNTVAFYKLKDHAGLRFAAFAFHPVSGVSFTWVMGAISEVIDPRAMGGELLRHPAMQILHVFLGIKPARHAG